ncbi:hypothetical protein MASR2M41_18610 [Flammeovirgaceae bacterium]
MKNLGNLSQVLSALTERGYTSDFSVHASKDCLVCKMTTRHLLHDEFEVDEVYHIIGTTNTDEETVVFALSSKKYNIKGVMVNAFGEFSEKSKLKIIEKLKTNLKNQWS